MSDKTNQILDDISALSVVELADLVKALEDKFGVTAAPAAVSTTAAGAPAGEAAPSEEPSAFTVVLTSAGANKIAVIKALREINPQLGLKEAKDLSEKAGAEVLGGVNKATAEEAKTKLTAAGAIVELK